MSFWAIAAIFLGSWLVHRQKSWSLRQIMVAYVLGLRLSPDSLLRAAEDDLWVHTDLVGQYMDPSGAAFATLSESDPVYRLEGSRMVSLACFLLTGVATFPISYCATTRANSKSCQVGTLWR